MAEEADDTTTAPGGWRDLPGLTRAVDRIVHAWPNAVLDAGSVGYPTGYQAGGGVFTSGHGDPTPTPLAARQLEQAGAAVAFIAELGDVLQALAVRLADTVPVTARTPTVEAAATRPAMIAACTTLINRWDATDRVTARRVYRLGDTAQRLWPPPVKPGTKMDGLTVGERHNDVELCGLCGDPASSGRSEHGQPLVRRIDGQAYHNLAEPGRGACWWQVWRQRQRPAA